MYLTKKILRWPILKFWVYKCYEKCWVCHKTAFNIFGLRQAQEFWSGSTQISFGSIHFGSDLDTPFSEQVGSIRILCNQHSFNTLAKGHSQESASKINHLSVSAHEDMSHGVNALLNVNESFCLDMFC